MNELIERAQRALKGAAHIVLNVPNHCGEGKCNCEYGDCYCDCLHCTEPSIGVADMRNCANLLPELHEIATRLGIGYIIGPLASPDGRSKYTCSGTSEQVKAFLERWAPGEGLVDLYGDPVSGFAGGYAVK